MTDEQKPHQWTLFDRLVVWVTTGFGVGFSPKAPGTLGSLVGIPFVLLANYCELGAFAKIVSVLIFCVLGWWLCHHTEKIWGIHDDQRIVIDEVVGQYITLIWFPTDALHLALGFGLFRLFDIWKPGPIGWIDEHGPGAWGTFFDDVLAGLVGAVVLAAISTWGLPVL